jgi:hypothetical protein
MRVHNLNQLVVPSKISSCKPGPCRKLGSSSEALSEHYTKLLNEASERACGAGASDLRRLKRQFSSLKNTYILYDVKEGFIDGMLPTQSSFLFLEVNKMLHFGNCNPCFIPDNKSSLAKYGSTRSFDTVTETALSKDMDLKYTVVNSRKIAICSGGDCEYTI